MQRVSRQLLLPVFILLSLILQLGCQPELTAEQYVDRAREYKQKGEIVAAIIELKNALRKDPKSVEGRFLLARINVDLAAGADAEKELQRALEAGLAPERAELLLYRALLLQNKYQQLIERDPPVDLKSLSAEDQASLMALRGHASLATGSVKGAEALYNMAMSIQQNNPEAAVGIARVQLARNDRDAARASLHALLDSRPDLTQAWSLLGLLDYGDGNLADAEQAFTRAMPDLRYVDGAQYARAISRVFLNKLDAAEADIQALGERRGDIPTVSFARGLLHYARGNFDEAQAQFAAVVGKIPNHELALYYAGATNAILGHLTTAASYLSRHLATNPANTTARKLLAQVELNRDKPAEAQALALTILAEAPDDATTINLLVDIADQLGNHEAAIAYSQQVVDAYPESPLARVRRSNVLVSAGMVDEGFKGLEQTLELYPQSREAADSLVQQHLVRGELDAALTAARDYRDRHPTSAAPYVSLGLVSLARKENQQASDSFKRVLEIEPENPSALQGLALIAIGEKDYPVAEAYYTAALEGQPNDLVTLMNLEKLMALQGDQSARETILERAIAGNPETVTPRLALGRLYLQIGDWESAIKVVDSAPAGLKNDKDLLGVLASAQLADRRYGQAKITLTRLAKLAPNHAQVQFYLARAHEGLQDHQRMRAALERTLELDPAHIPAIIGLGRLAVQTGNITEAESRLVQARQRVDADDADLLLVQAELAELQKDWVEAALAYRKLLSIGPASVALRRLARALWNSGDRDSAVREYEQWLTRFPQDGRAQLELSQRYQSLGRTREAIASYQSSLVNAPGNLAAVNNLAMLLVETDPEAAHIYAQQAYQLAPDSPAVLDTLAATSLRTGDLQRAALIVDRALSIQPDNLSLRYRNAQILEAQGQRRQATGILRKILQSGEEFSGRVDAEAMLTRLGAGS